MTKETLVSILLVVVTLAGLAGVFIFYPKDNSRQYLLVAATYYHNEKIDMRKGLHIDIVKRATNLELCTLERDILNGRSNDDVEVKHPFKRTRRGLGEPSEGSLVQSPIQTQTLVVGQI